MAEFDKGWWYCFISFANELCMWERDCDRLIIMNMAITN